MAIVYLNGQFIPEEKAVVSIKTHALHYGTGCFEGIRAYFNEKQNVLYVFRMLDHFKRFEQSAKILFVKLGKAPEELCEITVELLKKNFEKTDIYIRPLAFKSDKAVGNFNLTTLADSVAIYTTALGRVHDTTSGITAKVTTWTRVSDNAIPPRGKITGSYANTSLAKTESALNGADEALFMDSNGHIVEGSAENIFLIRDNVVFTPTSSDDILQGITKNTIMTLFEKELHLKVIERSIDRSEIYHADEILLVGTGAEVAPVIKIDERVIGNGKAGNLTTTVKDLYHKAVRGELTQYSSWVTRVSA